MNEILGRRIKELREEKKLTQDTVAKNLEMSRQKFARIEKGQTDISYELIVKLAHILGVETKEITKVAQNEKQELFRFGGNNRESFSQVEDIVDMFFANRTLYNKMNLELDDE